MSGQHAGTLEFLDLPFALMDVPGALAQTFALAEASTFTYIVTPNVDHMVRLHTSASEPLLSAYRGAAMRLCDSRILSLLASWSGLAMPVVAGSDLTAALIVDPRLTGRRVAIVGAEPRELAWLSDRRSDVDFVQHVPPMGVLRDASARAAIVAFINGSGADLVLMTLGSPASELICAEIAQRGEARGVALCIGASLEFLTGRKRRAPRLLQNLRLEWAFRLASEPGRLWRRYLIEGPNIVGVWWRWRSRRPKALL